jgi:hypothetical protein
MYPVASSSGTNLNHFPASIYSSTIKKVSLLAIGTLIAGIGIRSGSP